MGGVEALVCYMGMLMPFFRFVFEDFRISKFGNKLRWRTEGWFSGVYGFVERVRSEMYVEYNY